MDNELIDLLRTVSGSFHTHMQEQVAASGCGLTAFQARLINLVGRNEGVSQLALGTFLDRDKAQIARAVKEVEAKGLLRRRANAADWRSKSLALTAAGKRMHARLDGLRGQLAARVLGGLSDDDKKHLRSALGRMAEALEVRPGEPPSGHSRHIMS